MTERDAAIARRILEGYSLRAVGKEFCISGQRVNQILQQAGLTSDGRRRACKWRPTKTTTFVERFWALVKVSADENACWEYTGRLNPKTGYGSVSIPTKNREKLVKRYTNAHRLAYTLCNRAAPKHWVSHLCHNKVCCNPAHLVDMPIERIMKIREEKHRRNQTPLLKFSAEDAQQIVDMWHNGIRKAAIARQFHTSYNTVAAMLSGRTKSYRPFVHHIKAAPCEQVPRNIMAANLSKGFNANNLQPQN